MPRLILSESSLAHMSFCWFCYAAAQGGFWKIFGFRPTYFCLTDCKIKRFVQLLSFNLSVETTDKHSIWMFKFRLYHFKIIHPSNHFPFKRNFSVKPKTLKSKKISNDQELIQSHPTSCPMFQEEFFSETKTFEK